MARPAAKNQFRRAGRVMGLNQARPQSLAPLHADFSHVPV